jgi:hypothetical protein
MRGEAPYRFDEEPGIPTDGAAQGIGRPVGIDKNLAVRQKKFYLWITKVSSTLQATKLIRRVANMPKSYFPKQIKLTLIISLLVLILLEMADAAKRETNVIYLKNAQIATQAQSRSELAGKFQELSGRHAIIQFDHIPNKIEEQQIAFQGIELLGYIPYYSWYAKISHVGEELPRGLRFVAGMEPGFKLSGTIFEYGIGPEGMVGEDSIKINVIFFRDISKEEILTLVNRYGTGENIFNDTWEIVLGRERLNKFALEDAVQWIDNVPPPPEAHMDIVRARIHADEVQEAPYNLHGAGFVAAMWDQGSPYPHTDFASRITEPDGSPDMFHPTKVAGIMAGNGTRSEPCGGTAFQWRGIATEAYIISYDWNNPIVEHDSAINIFHAIVSQNSWGFLACSYSDPAYYCSYHGAYGGWSRDYDRIVRGLYGAPITIVGSAGNDGDCIICQPYLPLYPYGTVIGPIATSKNALSVAGTIVNDDSLWQSSSRGPTNDGRMKPDIAAPSDKRGAYIFAPERDDCYWSAGGTSISAPQVSGAVILVNESYHGFYGQNPIPSTVRAILYHTAEDIGNAGPDYCFGYGRIDIKRAIDLVQADQGLGNKIISNEINNGELKTFGMLIGGDTPILKVTLAWDDKEAEPGSGITLVNDLDLLLISPFHIANYPWHLDWSSPSNPATTGIDVRNNSEQASVNNPDSGLWIVQVTGSVVPDGPQVFSLVGDFVPIESGLTSISGHVFGEDSLPLSGVLVSAMWGEKIEWTDSSGAYLLDSLISGAHSVSFSSIITRDSTVMGIYAAVGDTTHIDVYLRYLPGTLMGIITDSLSFPVIGGIITTENSMLSDTTNPDGVFQFDALASGIHRLFFCCTGYFDTLISEISILPADTTTLNIIARVIPCQVVIGDVNGSGNFTGLDVVYSVRYFKGGPHPPFGCNCPPYGIWFVVGDVNGSCSFSGLDVTYMVRYFKGGAGPIPCPDCPPEGLLVPFVPGEKPTPSVQPVSSPMLNVKPKAGSAE